MGHEDTLSRMTRSPPGGLTMLSVGLSADDHFSVGGSNSGSMFLFIVS